MGDASLPKKIEVAPEDGKAVTYVLSTDLTWREGRAKPREDDAPRERSPKTDADALPVYRIDDEGSPAAATGRIFVRTKRGGRIKDLAPAFEKLDLVIEETHDHAPHAAWLVDRGGRIAASLRSLDALRKVKGVVAASPQLLQERKLRRRGRGRL